MKKFMILFAVMFMASANVFSQEVYYRCTGDNVNIRKGPGTKFGRIMRSGSAHCGNGVAQLWKGAIVCGDGKVKNGFLHVTETGPDMCWDEGWVSAQFLKKATKCPECNGQGTTGRKCPVCNGSGWRACCFYTGMELCPKCGYVGYY